MIAVRQPVDADLLGEPERFDFRPIAEGVALALEDERRRLNGLEVLARRLGDSTTPMDELAT